MGKNRKQASLTNVVQYDSNFNLSIGSSTSSSFNSSGSIIAASVFTGSLSGSVFGLGNTVSFSSSVSSDLVNLESKSATTANQSEEISLSKLNSNIIAKKVDIIKAISFLKESAPDEKEM